MKQQRPQTCVQGRVHADAVQQLVTGLGLELVGGVDGDAGRRGRRRYNFLSELVLTPVGEVEPLVQTHPHVIVTALRMQTTRMISRAEA